MVMFPSASGLTRRRPTSERQCMARNDVDSAALRDLLTKGWAETLRKGAGGEIISIPVLLMWDAMTKFEGYWRFQECMDMAEEDYLMAGTARLWLNQNALQKRRTPWGTCKFVPLPSDEAGIELESSHVHAQDAAFPKSKHNKIKLTASALHWNNNMPWSCSRHRCCECHGMKEATEQDATCRICRCGRLYRRRRPDGSDSSMSQRDHSTQSSHMSD